MTKAEFEPLSDAALEEVAGGLNPQPLPPCTLLQVLHERSPMLNFIQQILHLKQFTLPVLPHSFHGL